MLLPGDHHVVRIIHPSWIILQTGLCQSPCGGMRLLLHSGKRGFVFSCTATLTSKKVHSVKNNRIKKGQLSNNGRIKKFSTPISMQLFIKVSYSKSLIPHLLFNQRYLSLYSKGARMRILLHAALK